MFIQKRNDFMSERVYPDWVQKQKTTGTTVKKVGNNYYLYKHSSKRVRGKKNPVPVDTYIGKITPDGLSGFKEAIGAVYPQAQIQRCVIHMLRNSFKYVNYNDLKKFSSDFKAVYNALNEEDALLELDAVREKWEKKYPYAIRNWENNWEDVSSFFQFSDSSAFANVFRVTKA